MANSFRRDTAFRFLWIYFIGCLESLRDSPNEILFGPAAPRDRVYFIPLAYPPPFCKRRLQSRGEDFTGIERIYDFWIRRLVSSLILLHPSLRY